jgi:hypothetical protein
MTDVITLTEATANAERAVVDARRSRSIVERFAQFVTRRRIAKLRADIVAAQERIRSLGPMATECKRKAQVTYEAELKNIDLWKQAEYTAAKIVINSAAADLAMLGEEV